MLRLLLNELRFRRTRTAALGAAVLVAATSFVLLTSAAQTTAVRVRGSVEANYRSAYDILVRPTQSFAQLERARGLVRNNYLAGIFGGITFEQYNRIKRLPGVEVAAPIANLGYIMSGQPLGMPIDRHITKEPVQLFRIRRTWLAHDGTSRYDDGSSYIYYTRRNVFDFTGREVVPGSSEPVDVGPGFSESVPPQRGPFDLRSRTHLSLYSELAPGIWGEQFANADRVVGRRSVGAWSRAYFPLFVAAVDPVQESRLLRLDDAIVSGRYLRSRDGERISGARRVPAIASTRAYVDEKLEFTVERLRVPKAVDVPRTLASARGYPFVESLSGEVIERRRLPLGPLYQRLLRERDLPSLSYWTTSDVRYGRVSAERLRPSLTTNDASIWESPGYGAFGRGTSHWPAPPSNHDTQFRRLEARIGSHRVDGGIFRRPDFEVVGRYDPTRLPGFSPLSQVPLETYYPPTLEAADAVSRRVLPGGRLLPTQNLGDYIQQPPLVLTTLEGLKPFLNAKAFEGARAKAPISVIRIRVAGVKGPDELSQERVRAIATRIRDVTGLDVDITVGSSPRELLVELPKGKFGRPPLLLKEGWVKKGVSVSFLQALGRKDLALFTLIPLVCAFFLGNGTFAGTRARRREIGTLLCVGWSQRSIFALVLGELALVGALAGLLGIGVSAGVVALADLDASLARTLLVLPLSVLLAVVGGLLPAWRAAHAVPLDAVRPTIAGAEGSGRARRMRELAFVNLRRLPARTIVGGLGLFVGVAALTLMLAINRAFKGQLVGTVLGDAITVQIRGVDFLAAALIVALAALSLADVLYLNLRERSAELVTLRTFGWEERHVQKLVALEALGLGFIGSVSGALLGLVTGVALLGVPFLPLLIAAFLAALGGLVVALLASLLPLSQIARLTPPSVLAAE